MFFASHHISLKYYRNPQKNPDDKCCASFPFFIQTKGKHRLILLRRLAGNINQ